MPINYDHILLETVQARRARLLAAFVYGERRRRRRVIENGRRFLVSAALAAVLAAGCVGFAFVRGVIARQAHPNSTSFGRTRVAPALPSFLVINRPELASERGIGLLITRSGAGARRRSA